MTLRTIFEAPYWQEDKGCAYQGSWTRLVIERPLTHPDGTAGWVGVIDSATLRYTDEAPWLDPWRGIASIGWLTTTLGKRVTPVDTHEALWQAQEGPVRRTRTLGQAGAGQDGPTAGWVGNSWIAGWSTDRMLDHGSVDVQNIDGFTGAITSLLATCVAQGYPHGIGWGMPLWTSGREQDRLPWRASAHQRLEMAQRLGPPAPWDVATARLSWAVMGRLHSALDAAERAQDTAVS